jgi:hypothetical protein
MLPIRRLFGAAPSQLQWNDDTHNRTFGYFIQLSRQYRGFFSCSRISYSIFSWRVDLTKSKCSDRHAAVYFGYKLFQAVGLLVVYHLLLITHLFVRHAHVHARTSGI